MIFRERGMIDKVRKYIKECGMLPEGAEVVAGVSGGADSVCLLRMLVLLREEFGIRLQAVHVNHKIRSEAAEDADYVRMLCERWQVPFVLVEEDVEALAKKERISCEEAGRLVRYRAFEEALDGKAAGCIAVAHNREDRAETLLFHLFRGTGLAGMGSIRPVRENADGSRIIRPLLCLSRAEIEAFLKKEGIAWRTDRTNLEDAYTRNRIRNRILPYAEENICSGAAQHLAQEAQLLAETSDFVERQTQEALDRCSVFDGERKEVRFRIAGFWKEDPFLQDHMVKSVMQQVGKQRDLTAAHVREVKRLFLKECASGRRVYLPVCGIAVYREFDVVAFEKWEGDSLPEQNDELVLKEGVQQVPGLGPVRVRILKKAQICDNSALFWENIPENKYTKWFDYDKIIESVVLRKRRTGDYLTINEKLERKSLKRYLIEEKVPAQERSELWVLADGSHILWVPGHRISAAYKVTAQTAVILEVAVLGVDGDR